MKTCRCEEISNVKLCPFCGTQLTPTGVGITTYGQVEVWNCKEHGDTWIGAGRLDNKGLWLA